MRASKTTVDGSDVSSEQSGLDWEEVGRDLLATEADVRASEIQAALSDVSRSARQGEPISEEQIQAVSVEVEAVVSLLRVLDSSPFGEADRPTPKALDRLLSEVEN